LYNEICVIVASIIDIAKKDLGKVEKPNNSGFADPVLEKEMIEVGWQTGFAWCALISERWAKKAFPERFAELNKLFSASAVTTFANFKKAGYKISDTPVLGALVIWQKYVNSQPSWQGHAGIVSEVINDKEFKSIEGNGSVKGSRDGTTVVEQRRKLVKLDTGLNVMGFIILDNSK
jgi:hypothetical protein